MARPVFSVVLGSMLFTFAVCGPFLLLLSQRCLSILSPLSYLSSLSSLSCNTPFSIYYGEVKLLPVHSNNYTRLLQAHSNNYTKLLQVHSNNDKIVNIKLCKELCPPTESYKRTGVPSTARDSLRFALSSMNLSRWLLLPSKSLQVEKNIVRLVPSMCVFSLGLHS